MFSIKHFKKVPFHAICNCVSWVSESVCFLSEVQPLWLHCICSVSTSLTMLMRRCSDWLLGDGVQHWSPSDSEAGELLCGGRGRAAVTARVALGDRWAYFTFWPHTVTELKTACWRGGLFPFYGRCGFICRSCSLSLFDHQNILYSLFLLKVGSLRYEWKELFLNIFTCVKFSNLLSVMVAPNFLFLWSIKNLRDCRTVGTV